MRSSRKCHNYSTEHLVLLLKNSPWQFHQEPGWSTTKKKAANVQIIKDCDPETCRRWHIIGNSVFFSLPLSKMCLEHSSLLCWETPFGYEGAFEYLFLSFTWCLCEYACFQFYWWLHQTFIISDILQYYLILLSY